MDKTKFIEYLKEEQKKNEENSEAWYKIDFLQFLLTTLDVFLQSTITYDLMNKKVTLTYANYTFTYEY